MAANKSVTSESPTVNHFHPILGHLCGTDVGKSAPLQLVNHSLAAVLTLWP